MNFFKTFGFAAIISILAIALTAVYLGPGALFTVLLLCILEITFSFDNAVVNAKILEKLSHFWQQIFLSVGIIIAVFGMRIVFPILLVDITSPLDFGQVINLASTNPEQYAHYLELAMPSIAAFGGAFLMMVFFSFFVIENEKPYWLRPIERTLRKFPRHIWSVALLVLALLAATALIVAHPDDRARVMVAGSIGIAIYTAIHLLTEVLQKRAEKEVKQHKNGLVGAAAFTSFLYLEVLDASFSLDGVIGAFAITSSVVMIAVGLGVGAVWVRSMTIALVRHQTLAKFAHLSQGAHWAIGVLSFVLFISVNVHVPEAITGLLGVSIIVTSIFSSLRRQAKLSQLQ